MSIFKKNYTKDNIKKLIKEKDKQDKKINKEMEKKTNAKYALQNFKLAKKEMEKQMLREAMTIDTTEYEKITRDLKENLNKKYL